MREGTRTMSTTESETLVGGQGRVGPSGEAGSQTYVYFFGEGHAEGHGAMKDVLGGKGAGLAEMTNAGVPVPPGFTISTQACNAYYASGGTLPAEVDQQMDAALARLEGLIGK